MYHSTTTLPVLLLSSGLCLSLNLSAGSGGGLIADGTAGTQISSQGKIINIQAGTQAGTNLLHSFREFNVEQDQIADFQAAPDTQNIISRVTGPNDSWIDGTIQSTSSKADLYLVNPNGVVFGENASLDVNGAFHTSTADYVTLADGGRVYAAPNQDVKLTVAAPEAFGFLDADISTIQINGSYLNVDPGQAVSLVGGEIQIASGGLKAEGGNIKLLGVASAGKVSITGSANNTSQSADISVTNGILVVTNQADSQTVGQIMIQGDQVALSGGKIIVGNQSAINASAPSLDIQANNITLRDDTLIDADTMGTGKSGSVQLQATQQTLLDNSAIWAESWGEHAGVGAGAQIKAQNITLTNSSEILARTIGTGQGGAVTLQANDTVQIKGSTLRVTAEGESDEAGSAGNLQIAATDIWLTDGAQINSNTTSSGNGGDVMLEASNQIVLTKKSTINASTSSTGNGGIVILNAKNKVDINQSTINMQTTGESENAGAGGELLMQAADIVIANDSTINASTSSAGLGGKVWLDATKKVDINQTKIITETTSTAEPAGDGGDLTIKAMDIVLADGTKIYLDTEGTGQGGSVELAADKLVEINKSEIRVETRSEKDNAGKGGDIRIEAMNIVLTDQAELDAETEGTGQGGAVSLTAEKKVSISNSLIEMSTTSQMAKAGNGGDLTINAADIALTDGADIDATTSSTGQGGSIKLEAIDQIRISGQKTAVSSSSHSPSAAGNIQLQATDLLLQDGAAILSTSGFQHPKFDPDLPHTGAAGQIQINLSDTLRMNGKSKINTSTAGTGNAGNIAIGTPQTRPIALRMESGSSITSGSESTADGAGQAGQLKIFTGETIDLEGGSSLTTASENAGGGGIHIETRDRLRLQDSAITTSVKDGKGQGGSIFVDPVFIILEDSKIQANAHGGSGGNITLVANYLLQSGPSVIEASSALSAPGNVDVQAINVDGSGLQAATEIDPLDVAQWQKVPCNLRRGGISRLVMAGYDAHPTPVDDLLSFLPIWARIPPSDWSSAQPVAPITKSVTKSVPATIFATTPSPAVQHFWLAATGDLVGSCHVL